MCQADAAEAEEAGATSVEYALLATLIALVIVGAVTALGTDIAQLLGNPELLDALTP